MSSGMEPEVRDFLSRVGWSVTLVLVYLLILFTVGIYGNWFFFYEKPTTGNYIFYVWILFSTVMMIRLLIRFWKKKFPHG
ncbi:MAG: hypothetical protein QM726_00555 [Chitinophagaceae bacterium]